MSRCADTVYVNGRVYTFDTSFPRAEAIALRDGRILAVGSSADMRELMDTSGSLIDLRNGAVFPGFVDCHVHLLWYGLGFSRVDLTGLDSLERALQRVEAAVDQTAEGGWVLGRGWDESLWTDGRLPTKDDLDRVSPAHPVALARKCGHIWWVNDAALRAAGVRAQTPDPPGGRIDRRTPWVPGGSDASPSGQPRMRNATPGAVAADGAPGAGEPTGILRENAIRLVSSVAEHPTLDQALPALRTAIKMAHREGVVGVHAMEARDSLAACQVLRGLGELDLRVHMQIPAESLDAAVQTGIRGGLGDDWLRIGGVKLFADGSLGGRTASMLEPYEGEPRNRGIMVTDAESIAGVAARAAGAGLPLYVHAIGDRANRDTLDAFEALARNGVQPLRHRIEHAQILRTEDVARFASLGVIASVQPIHATADMEIAVRYLGERAARAYVFRDLLAAGARLAFGSDAPVEDLSPLRGIHAAVTRRRADGFPGPEGWHPEQRITVAQAVAAYTVGAAYAGGVESSRGSLTAGKLADFVVLSSDIMAAPHEAILEARVVATVVGGRMVHQGPGIERLV